MTPIFAQFGISDTLFWGGLAIFYARGVYMEHKAEQEAQERMRSETLKEGLQLAEDQKALDAAEARLAQLRKLAESLLNEEPSP